MSAAVGLGWPPRPGSPTAAGTAAAVGWPGSQPGAPDQSQQTQVVEATADEPCEAEPAEAVVPTVPRGTSTGRPSAGPETPAGKRPDRVRKPGKAADFPRPLRSRVLAVSNQKGGVGKTTTTVNVAAALALHGLRVLVLDMDPQANASTGLGVRLTAQAPSVYDVLLGERSLADVVVPVPGIPGLLLAPSTIRLAGAEVELVSVVAREYRLRRALRAYLAAGSQAEPVDYVIMDCPPSLGLLTVNALAAASEVLIPIQCEYYALEGLSALVSTVDTVRAHLNEDLTISTILLTMYDARTRLAEQVADDVRTHFGSRVLGSVVPRSVRISEAPGYGQTVLTYDPGSRGAQSYLLAAQEIARAGAVQEHL